MKQTQTKRNTLAVAVIVAAAVVAGGGAPDVRGQVLGPALTMAGHDKPVRVVFGRFTSDVTLSREYDWVVRGEVFIAAPARLQVSPGTRVVADAGTLGILLIEEGAQLEIDSTALVEAPFVTNVTLVMTGAASVVEVEQKAEPPAASPPAVLLQNGPSTPATETSEPALTRSVSTPRLAAEPGAGLVLEREAGSIADGSMLTARRRSADAESASRAVVRPRGEPAGAAGMIDATPDTGPNETERAVGQPSTVPGLDKPVRVIHGRFTTDLHLTSDTYWVLRGAVFIGAPGRIIIDAGTRIVGELATTGTLIIERGAQILAEGTREQPIVFTSDQPIGDRGRGDWGGLVINGNAPINLLGGVGIGEGSTGIYGGNDPNDNSGVLRYVRVEFAGIEFSPDNELNGIAFQGVGRGTTVDHIQVTFNKDDGIEMFGGTVDVKHVVLTSVGDDSMDWTHGWQGRAQFVIVQQRGDDADRGIEADNLSNNNDLLPRSKPTIYNMTIVGDPDTNEGPEGTQLMELREGTAGLFRNFILVGSKLQAFRVTGAASAAQAAAGELSMRHAVIFGNGTNLHSSTSVVVAASGGTINVVDPQLIRPYDHANPDFRPAPGSPAVTLGFETPPDDGFFDTSVTYRGALSPNAAEDWTQGWTNYEQR
jgi:hypothetical protein